MESNTLLIIAYAVIKLEVLLKKKKILFIKLQYNINSLSIARCTLISDISNVKKNVSLKRNGDDINPHPK